MLPQPAFLRTLCLERKRAERSRRLFILMLLEDSDPAESAPDKLVARVVPTIRGSIRETDLMGWHKEGAVLGVIFAELGTMETRAVLVPLRARIHRMLRSTLPADEMRRINITFHCFPEDWKSDSGPPTEILYPDLVETDDAKQVSRRVKRAIDVLGSALALVVLSPLLLAVAVAVKLTSPGPVIFRQKRIGQHGVPFTLLKFRSMRAVNDPEMHKAFVTRFIAGDAAPATRAANGQAVYKITNDPRLTRIGGFLRKSSFDELPQFLNVLRGEMSLVGPRPPLVYELEAYDVWHRRRLLEAKPGITGLWQVNGRSRIQFDDMVRLDLRYARTWSLWLDLKILAKTPLAMFSGAGAY
jgi:lipopolysaccharide/colanic/teichoic acid biosynthesis glycosyltransferase